MNWIKKNKLSFVMVLMLVAGLFLLAYPSVSNYWNSFHQSQAISTYAENISKMDTHDYEHIIADADEYNVEIASNGVIWDMAGAAKERYESLLNADGTGVMGYIDVPAIKVKLPIYHGTSENVLQTSIGHLEGTSLPVGGKNTHTVLSGHRGLPSAKLFSDLDHLKEGDQFTLTILNETLTYEVDQIRIIEPTDISELQILHGQDLCTLVTCTPYGINTHRLLVRGHRIANANGDAKVLADALQIEPLFVALCIAVPVILILFIVAVARKKKS